MTPQERAAIACDLLLTGLVKLEMLEYDWAHRSSRRSSWSTHEPCRSWTVGLTSTVPTLSRMRETSSCSRFSVWCMST